jgi:hypothetical protein
MAVRSRIRKSKIRVGMRVTCRVPVEAFGSEADGAPVCKFEPGMEGRAAVLDVPRVTFSYRWEGGTASYVCVAFMAGGRERLCALDYNNIRVLRGG